MNHSDEEESIFDYDVYIGFWSSVNAEVKQVRFPRAGIDRCTLAFLTVAKWPSKTLLLGRFYHRIARRWMPPLKVMHPYPEHRLITPYLLLA
jgi:hypothetical protein